MITLHPISAGSGIDYLMSTVAGGDYRSTVKGLDEYWAEGGDTPGQWLGAQAEALGFAGSLVEREAADAVFKDALDPVTGAKLGRAWPRYAPADVLYERLLAAEPEASEGRREKLRAKANQEGSRTARCGWEMVFSPVKSFSVLWGTADDATRARLEEVEQKAFEKVFARMESEACWTRSGPTAASQVTVKAEGFIAASFIHRSSRAGDPDFHRHLALSAKVRTADGRWLALDARPLHSQTVALSEMYTTEVERGMYEAFSVVAGPRIDSIRPDRRPVREFLGVSPEAVREYSARRRSTERELDHLTQVFTAREEREPTRVESYALAQSAALSQRPAKEKRDPESERRDWQERARQLGIASPERWLEECAAISREVDSPRAEPASLSDVVDGTLAALESSRPSWTRTNVAAEAYRQLTATGWHLAAGERFDDVVDEVVDTALSPAHCAPLDPAGTVEDPAQGRADGTGLFSGPRAEQYSSHRLLAAEADLLEAALVPVPVERFEPADIDRILSIGDRNRGFTPSAEQRAAVRHLLGSDVRVNAVIGPTGVGKNAVIQLLGEAADAREIPVISLASSQSLARNLAAETGVRTESTARWRTMSERYASGTPDWTLAPGQVVIVDEAGRAPTPDLHAILRQVQAVDGRLILVGDPGRQSSAGAGGTLALIEADAKVARLSARRFRDTGGAIRGWEADAAHALSVGDDSCFDTYDAHGRIRHGGAEAMHDAMYEAWQRDSAEGLQSVMIAPSDAIGIQLSRRARADRVALGEVDDTVTVALSDGSSCGAGDRIITRVNNRKILSEDGRQWVRDGDLWTVGKVGADGSLTVRHERTSRQLALPADYSAQAVDLAYCVSKDRARELTADTAHALFDDSMDRDSAYPVATRGRLANHLYLVTETPGTPATAHGTEPAARQVFAGILRREADRYSATAVERLLARKAASLRIQAGRMTYALDNLADVQGRRAVAGLLDERAAAQLLEAPAWPAVREQFTGFAQAGFDSDRLLRETFRDPRGNSSDFDGRPLRDLAAVLHSRAAKVMENDSAAPHFRLQQGAERPAIAVSYRAAGQARGDDLFQAIGLSLPAVDPSDERAASLHQSAAAAQRRFAQTAETARAEAAAGQGWAAAYGPEPADPGQAHAWRDRVAAAAAYRDLTAYQGPDPTGPAPAEERSGERGLWRAAQIPPDPAVLADTLGSEPPAWLADLGPRPADTGTGWDTAAAAVGTYRKTWHYDEETDLLGPRPAEAVQRGDYDAAVAAVEAWQTARHTAPGSTQENAPQRLSEASSGAVPRIPQEAPAPETTPAVSPAAAVPSWRQRPHGRLNDTELRQALQQTLLSARTAQKEAQNGDKTVEALREAARPGGLVEQRVDALQNQVRAIAALDTAAAQARALETSHAAAVTERQSLEEALAATGRLGRPALRGTERERAEQRLRDIGGELDRLRQQRTETATRQAQYEALAGDPAARERALARWEKMGGTKETALAHAIQANDRRIRQAEAASQGFRTTSARLRPRLTALRAEQTTREAMTPQERRNEATERASRSGPRQTPTTPSPDYRSPGQEPGQER